MAHMDTLSEIFLQKSSVNLLKGVLDTPEFFWHAPDAFLTLYKRCETRNSPFMAMDGGGLD